MSIQNNVNLTRASNIVPMAQPQKTSMESANSMQIFSSNQATNTASDTTARLAGRSTDSAFAPSANEATGKSVEATTNSAASPKENIDAFFKKIFEMFTGAATAIGEVFSTGLSLVSNLLSAITSGVSLITKVIK